MRMTIGFLGLLCLVVSGCSDDGVPVQNPDSSSTGVAPTTGQTTDQTTDQGTETGPTGSGSVGSDGPADSTGEASTGIEPTGGSSTSGSSTDTGTSTSTGDTSTTGEPCMPLTDDPSAIGVDCLSDLDCPDGYECQPFEGFAFQLQCQILCAQTCECPLGLTCNPVMDKSGASWTQCE